MAKKLKIESEVWKPLPDYGYEVSNLARVRRTEKAKGTRVGRFVKPCKDAYGRMVFNVTKNGKVKQFKLHRAVMLAFCGECPSGREVAHLDGNTENNHLSNLIYATPKENNRHKVQHGTQPKGEQIWCAKLTEGEVRKIRLEYANSSYRKLAAKYGVHTMTIAAIITRKNWKHI